MGAVTVARAPLFHPSWHFSSWPGQTKENDCGQPPGLVFRLRNLAAITPLTHYPRPRARFRVISSASDRTNASSWAPRVDSSPPLPSPPRAGVARFRVSSISATPRVSRAAISNGSCRSPRLSSFFSSEMMKERGRANGDRGMKGWRVEGRRFGDVDADQRERRLEIRFINGYIYDMENWKEAS